MFSKQSLEYFASSNSILSWLLNLAMHLNSLRYVGSKFECPICKGKFRTFLLGGRKNLRPHAKCPRCRSLERHRLVWLYLINKTNFINSKLKLLYVSPEYCIRRKIQKLKNIQYISIDLENPIAMIKMDITDLKFTNSSFDCILCLHVLEHVEEDEKAMQEFYRVLKPNGWAIFQVPIFQDKTYENSSIRTRAQRLKHFGQEDHVRLYGSDFKDKLMDVGFLVNVEAFDKEISPDLMNRYRLTPSNGKLENLYYCTKAIREGFSLNKN
jgi:predicted SAM-dependent methyltransferase